MRTRTLMLLSVLSGLAILLAGGVLLVQLVNRAEVVAPSAVGATVRVGDMRVIVEGSREVPGPQGTGTHEVDIAIGGVEDPTGSAGFRLLAAARPAPLVRDCGPIEIAVQRCTLVFSVTDTEGSRQLFYERGDQTARWVLVAP